MKKRINSLFCKFLFATIFLQFPLQSCIYASENRGVYAIAGQQYLRSLPQLALKKKSSYDDEKPQISLQHSSLKEQEKLNILLQQLSEFGYQGNVDEVTEDLITDLQVFYGHSADPSCTLHQLLDHTTTVFGKAGLIKMLAQPSADIDCLQARQRLIKELVENPDLFITVHNLLQKVRAAESGFFSYWQEEDPEITKLVNEVYWSKRLPKKINNNAVALEVGTRLNNLATGLKLSFPFVVLGLGNCVVQYTVKREVDFKSVCKNVANSAIALCNPKELYDRFKDIQSGKAYEDSSKNFAVYGQKVPYTQKQFNKGNYIGLGIGAVFKYAIVAGYLYWVKTVVSKAKQHKDIINYLHTKLIDVATVTNAIKEITWLADSHQAVLNGLSLFSHAQDLFDPVASKSAECKTVVELLQKNTFKGNASFFSLSGRVLSAHILFKEIKNDFCQALEVIGELDACLSLAKLYKEHRNKNTSYCFVEYKKSDVPFIQLEDFWNPFVDADKAVVNTLVLDGNQLPRGVILTGSNTGGKSTLLKGLLINLLLAQTGGIVAAKKAVIAPSEHIVSSLNISDNTAAGTSLFQSEVNRAASIENVIEKTDADNQFVFVGIDELFTGTAVEKGSLAAIQFVQQLIGKKNCLFIFATHFPSVTELEKANGGICKNMKMEAFIKEDGSIARPFKLEDGISTHNIANAILNEQLNNFGY